MFEAQLCADPISAAPSGPLLYHFENMANELSVELSYEDIRTAVATTGFHMEVRQNALLPERLQSALLIRKAMFVLKVENESVQTTYTENQRSMLRYVYDCVFFVARKPAEVDPHSQEDQQPALKSPRKESDGSQT